MLLLLLLLRWLCLMVAVVWLCGRVETCLGFAFFEFSWVYSMDLSGYVLYFFGFSHTLCTIDIYCNEVL